MDQQILTELKRLRQDLEVGAAINIIEGINTIETLAVLGHWVQTRRAPTQAEARALERLARKRWAAQVRHTLGLLKADGTELDERMAELADLLVNVQQPAARKIAAKRTTPRKLVAKGKRRA